MTTFIRKTEEYHAFTAGQAASITGVSRELQAGWRRRGLLDPLTEPGWAIYDPGEVLEIFIMAHMTKAGIGVKAMRWVVAHVLNTTREILWTLPDAVRIEVDPALGEEFEVRERAKIADYAATHRANPYIVVPLPEREDAPGPGLYHRGDFADLPDLIDPDAPMALTIDCAALARAFLARVRKVTDEPLQRWTFTLEREDGA